MRIDARRLQFRRPCVGVVLLGVYLLLLPAAFTAGCARRQAPALPTPPPSQECALFPDAAAIPVTLAVGLTETVHPDHAPWPRNDSERFLFRQLYETLVRVDCRGRVMAGLAQTWQMGEDGRSWTFTLRDQARFWDGTPVRAADVIASWAATPADDGSLPPARLALAEMTAVNERVLTVRLTQTLVGEPLLFADPSLAVVRASGATGWKQGSGAYRITLSSGQSDVGSPSRLLRAAPVAEGASALPVLELRVEPGADPRDLLEAGVDLLLTRDASALEYAASWPEMVSVGLGWSRSYVLVPGRWRLRQDETREVAAPPLSFRQALARDAVRGEARGSVEPFWWSEPEGCPANDPGGAASGEVAEASAARIAYSRSDPVARELAERLVALTVPESSQRPDDGSLAAARELLGSGPNVAVGLAGQRMAAALRSGADSAYILTIPSQVFARCQELAALQVRTRDAATGSSPVLLPLVETRLRAVVRGELPGALAEWDGTLRLTVQTGSAR